MQSDTMKSGTQYLLFWIQITSVCSISNRQIRTSTIEIEAAKAEKKDEYQCIAIPIEHLTGQYIVGYHVEANIEIIHHLSISICGQYASNEATWDCYDQQGDVCIGPAKDLEGYSGGGMGNNGATYMLPNDVGIKIGRDVDFYTMVAEAHFKEPNTGPSIVGNLTFYLADYASMRFNGFTVATTGYIPAKAEAFSAETACTWKGVEVFPFSFVTHTHDRGYYVEGFRIRNGTWTVIGQGGPHIHDGKIKTDENGNHFNLIPGDVIATRCLYNNTENKKIVMGLDNENEMCAFGVLFKYRPEDEMVYYRRPLSITNIQAFDWCSMEETKSRCSHN